MFQRVGPMAFKKDLTNIRAMCSLLGNPQDKFKSIHIAGTNGKGSVAHMLASVFTAAGFKTGLYTSPHYKDFRERVKIDGKLISKKVVIDFVNENKEQFNDISPSFFEWTVALAFDTFSQEKVDIAIVETGMGGRLDSTNILNPLLSIITNIGYDHQQFLGETLPEIAGEKAGIIKKDTPVVIGESHEETKLVFLNKSDKENAPIYFADSEYTVKKIRQSQTHAVYEIEKNNEIINKELELGHLANYQKFNLPPLLKALEILENLLAGHAKNINQLAIEKGLSNLKEYSNYQGRWQILHTDPTVLCDSAHNKEGLSLAMEGLRDFNYDNLHIVFGMVNDKSPDKVLKLLPKEAKYYFAKANIPRGMDAKILSENASQAGLNGKAYRSVRKALAAAKLSAGKKDLIYVGGSIFVVAEVI